MNIIKRVINGLKSKSKYSDKILREYNDLRYDNSPSEIIINSLSEIIKANNCIFGCNHYTKHNRIFGCKNNLEDTDRLKEIIDSKHNIWKNRQLFELAINEYFKTESIIVEYEKGCLHVYQPVLEYIKKDSPEYIVLKEKIDMCSYNNDILHEFQFRPNLFDISL